MVRTVRAGKLDYAAGGRRWGPVAVEMICPIPPRTTATLALNGCLNPVTRASLPRLTTTSLIASWTPITPPVTQPPRLHHHPFLDRIRPSTNGPRFSRKDSGAQPGRNQCQVSTLMTGVLPARRILRAARSWHAIAPQRENRVDVRREFDSAVVLAASQAFATNGSGAFRATISTRHCFARFVRNLFV